MTIIIPYKRYERNDSETYFMQLSFSTSGHLLEAGTFPKIVKKQAIFQFGWWSFIRAWAFIRIFTVGF